MDGWDITFCFLGVNLTLPFVRGDSKFEISDRKYPLDIMGRGSRGVHIKKFNYRMYKMQLLFSQYVAIFKP